MKANSDCNKRDHLIRAVVAAVCLAGMSALAARAGGPPAVGASSIFAERGEKILIHGDNLDGKLKAAFYCTPKEEKWGDAEIKQSLARCLAGKAQPLRIDEKQSPWMPCDPEGNDPNTRLFALGWGGIGALWLKNTNGISSPYVFKRPEIFGAHPAKALPGDALIMWGVNLDAKFAVASKDGKRVEILTSATTYGHSGRYEDKFYRAVPLPSDLAPGMYSLYNWGTLGDHGWSEPLDIQVVARPLPPKVFDVRDFGAKGDGVNDDTTSIQKAIDEAGKQGGGQVRIPAGRYAVSTTLLIRKGVALHGDGLGSTTIECGRYQQFRGAFPKEMMGGLPPGEEAEYMEIGGKKYICHSRYPIDWLPQYENLNVLIVANNGAGLENVKLDVTAAPPGMVMVLIGNKDGNKDPNWCEDV
ncbi:MAG: glycosyl hydrolase family 28-related protein, partial [Kiritimatiellota bacterium]|nr:glycosyl hydrolase family 28-related protein [Kiritimatiellota bacterium]